MKKDNTIDSNTPIEDRLEALEAELAKYSEKSNTGANPLGFVKKIVKRVFCRQNLELFLSVAAIAISLATAFYTLGS